MEIGLSRGGITAVPYEAVSCAVIKGDFCPLVSPGLLEQRSGEAPEFPGSPSKQQLRAVPSGSSGRGQGQQIKEHVGPVGAALTLICTSCLE